MEAERQDGFIKELISTETNEVVKELGLILENKKVFVDLNNDRLQQLIDQYLQEKENIKDSCPTKDNNNNDLLQEEDIFTLIRLILKHKLDFSHRLDGNRNILEQWQKTRAFKNEELSIKFRENGNDYLRKGELKEALHFYNEALLFG